MIISREAKKTTDKVQHSLMEKNPLKLGIERSCLKQIRGIY